MLFYITKILSQAILNKLSFIFIASGNGVLYNLHYVMMAVDLPNPKSIVHFRM